MAQIAVHQSDQKIEHMLDMYATERFYSSSTVPKVRLKLIWWSMQLQILGNLKRLMDVVIASSSLLLILPFMLFTAIIIRLESPGPIIFRQTRIGRWGIPFTCYKFRSMYVDADKRQKDLMHLNEADGPVFKIQKDPRITRAGRIIRKLSIDELPQLFNVLKGDMSLVGPRPPLPHEVAAYKFEYLRRLEARPGITGLQQVSGRSDLDFNRWIELDLQYISQQSIRHDVSIILKTIPAVISGRGAY